MELKDRVGQLIMAGFEGLTPSPEIKEMITRHHLGGVILFKRNIESLSQLIRLTRDLQRLSPENPLFIGIDQEGGRVSRLPDEFTIFPPMADVAKHDSVPLCYSVGEIMAKELKASGINLDFAPVLDIHSNPKNPVIGDRAFGTTPAEVCKLTLPVIMGLQDNGVIACGKHFPGHGDTSTDSHKTLPKVDLPFERLLDFEMKPFQHAVANRLESIMTAHVLYKRLDPENPASLSGIVISEILREGMEFDGLVFSDDLEMQAILDHYTAREAAVKAVRAGSDIVLVCKRADLVREAYEGLLQAVQKGTISNKALALSLARISKVKEKYLFQFETPQLKKAREIVGCEAHREALARILEEPVKRKSSSKKS